MGIFARTVPVIPLGLPMAHPQTLEKLMNNRPLILIDVDGVLNPFYADEMPEPWTKNRITVNDGRTFTVFLNPEHGPKLLALAEETGAELAWGSIWKDQANDHIGPRIGLPRLPFAPMPFHGSGTKARSFVPWTDGRPFVWFDDDCIALDTAVQMVDRVKQPFLPVLINPATGLTDRHLSEARSWLLKNGLQI